MIQTTSPVNLNGSSDSKKAPTETPATETPAAETPAVETPAAETPAAETSAAETPAAETPAVEEAVAEQPTVNGAGAVSKEQNLDIQPPSEQLPAELLQVRIDSLFYCFLKL